MKRIRPGRVFTTVTSSEEETRALGRRLSRYLTIPGVVLLRGALGTGKTTLARGMAEGLGLKDPSLVHSPSFALVNVYTGRCPIYHVDLYRLESVRDLYSIGLDDFMGTDGVTIIEWAERLPTTSEASLSVELRDAGGDSRMITTTILTAVKWGKDPARRSGMRT